MTHTKYHTEAIVLGGAISDEASRTLYLLTKEFGFITGYVRGVREVSSKLRYSLQDFSYAYIDLVRGSGGWRVVSAVHIKNIFNASYILEQESFFVVGRIVNLIRRLINGEEKNEMLFNDTLKGFLALTSGELTNEDVRAMEVVLVMRILNHLGYWGDDATLSPFLVGDVTSPEHIERIKKEKPRAIGAINKALQETQL
ncbi:MAG: recombination protein O N-terminal domain-containing protein [Parcubacteria group bacterium]|nr:recombination protein O N-terminal domain-containing protein [Parcubacteria group bacterium]